MSQTHSTPKKGSEGRAVEAIEQQLANPADCEHPALGRPDAATDGSDRIETVCYACGSLLQADSVDIDWQIERTLSEAIR